MINKNFFFLLCACFLIINIFSMDDQNHRSLKNIIEQRVAIIDYYKNMSDDEFDVKVRGKDISKLTNSDTDDELKVPARVIYIDRLQKEMEKIINSYKEYVG